MLIIQKVWKFIFIWILTLIIWPFVLFFLFMIYISFVNPKIQEFRIGNYMKEWIEITFIDKEIDYSSFSYKYKEYQPALFAAAADWLPNNVYIVIEDSNISQREWLCDTNIKYGPQDLGGFKSDIISEHLLSEVDVSCWRYYEEENWYSCWYIFINKSMQRVFIHVCK